MKKGLIWVFAALMLLTACGQNKENAQGAGYVNITAEQAKEIMDTQEGYIILDTRTQEEYDESHIPGAILIPYDEVTERAEGVLTDKDQQRTAKQNCCGGFGKAGLHQHQRIRWHHQLALRNGIDAIKSRSWIVQLRDML